MPAIRCPHCQTAIKAPAQAIGRKVACPKCRKPFTAAAQVVSVGPRWFYAKDQVQHGPVSWRELKKLAARGLLTGADPVITEGQTTWLPAKDVPDLFAPPQPSPKVTSGRFLTRGRLAILAGGLAIVVLAIVFVPRFFHGPAETPKWSPEDQILADIKAATPVPPPKEDSTTTLKPRPPKLEPFELKTESEPALRALLDRFNQQRKASGLSQVALDADLSKGCQQHAEYVVRNMDHPKLSNAGGLQDEDADLPGFQEEGKKAAAVSLIAFFEPVKAFDMWLGRLLSRGPLLEPNLVRVGLGAAQNVRGDWVTILDTTRGLGPDPIAYPAPGQKDVPPTFSGGPEIAAKDAIPGFPVSFQLPAGKSAGNANFHLTDEHGNRVAVWTSTPEQPLPGVRYAGLFGLIPKQALTASTKYRARFTGVVDGQPLDKSWEFTTEDDADQAGVRAGQMVKRLNDVRAIAGLAPVTLDADLSLGCRNHARYLALNPRHPATQGLGAHKEDAKLPGATPQGAKAGMAADIALGDIEPLHALDGWMATLYHRIPLLDPHLQRIGFGCARGEMLGWITVLDVKSGKAEGKLSSPILYPVDGQKGVPLAFPPREIPNPLPEDAGIRAGYPITATFDWKAPLLMAAGSLEDERGQVVPCWFSSQESPANPKHGQSTACLIPKTPLAPNTSYRVAMSGTWKGALWKKKWQFTTGSAGLSPGEGAKLFLTRINQVRRLAGVPPVELAADLSKPCQAHADYLIKNADQRGPTINQENPKLSGFSLQGQEAARRSAIFSQAPTPTVQVDDHLATLSRRGALLDPTLRRIGLGCALEIGRGWINVLDWQSGHEDEPPVLCPAPNQEKVPCQGRDRIPGETKEFAGFPITAHLPPKNRVRNVRALLADSSGTTQDLWLSTPESPFDPNFRANVIAVHPRRPLRPGQTYTVTLTAEVQGREWRQSWRFSTAEE